MGNPSERDPGRRSLATAGGLLALVVLGLVATRARGSVEALALALALVVAGTAVARGLAARADEALPPPVLEALALLGFATVPASRAGHALAGLGAILVALARPAGASTTLLEEALTVAAAAGALALGLVTRSGPALALLAVLSVEAFGPRAEAGRARRRLPGFALAGAAALLEGYEWWEPALAARTSCLLALAVLAVLATAHVLGRTTALGRLVAGAVLVLALGLAPGEAATRAPSALALALVAGLLAGRPRDGEETTVASPRARAVGTLLLLLVLARAHERFGEPPALVLVLLLALVALGASALAFGRGTKASVLATALAALVAVEGGLRRKQQGSPDLVSPAAAPLLAERPAGLLEDGPTRRDTRGRLFSRAKPEGTHRTVLLGGSSAYGHSQTDARRALAARLEAQLGPLVKKGTCEVLCLAYPGWASDQELAAVLGEALDWEADLFLAIDGYNDLTYLSGKDTYPGDLYTWPQHRRGLAEPLRRAVATHSLLLRPLATRGAVVASWDQGRLASPEAANGFWLDGLVKNEEALATVARDLRARFAWASVPLVYDRETPGAGEEGARRKEPEAGEVARRSSELRRRVGPAVQARGGYVLELALAVSRRSATTRGERWFEDECHYTDRGIEVVAEETAAALAAAGALGP